MELKSEKVQLIHKRNSIKLILYFFSARDFSRGFVNTNVHVRNNGECESFFSKVKWIQIFVQFA